MTTFNAEQVDAYTKHLLGVPGARICTLVDADGQMLAQWVTTPHFAERHVQVKGLGQPGNVLVDSDGVLLRAWGG